jgi:hypothetical protein
MTTLTYIIAGVINKDKIMDKLKLWNRHFE